VLDSELSAIPPDEDVDPTEDPVPVVSGSSDVVLDEVPGSVELPVVASTPVLAAAAPEVEPCAGSPVSSPPQAMTSVRTSPSEA